MLSFIGEVINWSCRRSLSKLGPGMLKAETYSQVEMKVLLLIFTF